jgi:hypothetical protein
VRITVTWLDGVQETYDCPDYRISDGILYLDPAPGGLGPAQPRRVIPLGNVRIFTE